MQQHDIRPGDLLLSRGGEDEKWSIGEAVRNRIRTATDSPYTHAAIALSSTEIADARPGGVRIRPLQHLVDGAACVLVLARDDIWDAGRLRQLRAYVEDLEALGARYNYADALRFEKNKARHQAGITQALEDFFEKSVSNGATNCGPFFCSELVVACLIHIGYIDPSAAVVYDPGTHSPGDLLRDATFGYLVGYLSNDPGFKVPADDPLHALTRYNDVCARR